jgi:SAM-dependent MidA family methyltransferase
LANELLDAFPVHRVVRRGDALHELYVDVAEGRFVTVEGPPSTPALAAYFGRLGLWPPEGAIAEVNLGALAWLRAVAARLERGVVLFFDYGHPAEVLYSARYPKGTLRAYYRHWVDDDPYARVGEQDLTTHVDLTSVLLEGRAAGLAPLGVARQRDFLTRLGLRSYEAAVRAAELPAAVARASLAGLATLVRPGGLGDYWVVAFGRGLAGPLHGLDEQAAPLTAEPLPAALRPRLGWGDATTHDAPRRARRRGAPSSANQRTR